MLENTSDPKTNVGTSFITACHAPAIRVLNKYTCGRNETEVSGFMNAKTFRKCYGLGLNNG
jgi:hypothetical protein